MKYTASVLTAVVATVATAAAFAPSTPGAFVSVAGRTSASSRVGGAQHTSSCPCAACRARVPMLCMSEVAEETEVPPEVEAMDGVADSEEAHNADRPARGSGIAKHKKSGGGAGGRSGTPLADLEVGATVAGTVKAIQSYGAFLDIGAQTDALLHVSRLSDDFVSNVEDVVKAGDVVEVRIVSVDADKGQIAVTMRSEEAEAQAADRSSGGGRRKERPQRSGGDRQAQMAALASLAEKGFSDEQFVEGNVVSTLDFGAFVRFDASQLAEGVEGEIDGLVHISALTVGRADDVNSIVSVGDKVQVRVRSVDAAGGKVSLSMISKEDEPKPRERGQRQQRAPRARWSPEEMGAADWKESMDGLEQPSFANTAIVNDRRK